MNKIFKNIHGENVSVVDHTLDILKVHPDVEIHIGTDSQNYRRYTMYATVIAYRFGKEDGEGGWMGKGVHYIYTKTRIKKIRDLWSRLYKETELSIEIAEWFTSKINVNVQIDMDYNGDDKWPSHKLISATKGWATSLGYKVNVKPNLQIATRAADHLC